MRSSPQSYSGRFAVSSPRASGVKPNLVRAGLRNHEGRCWLWSVGFGITRFTPEANVHDSRICRHVRNSPIEKLAFGFSQGLIHMVNVLPPSTDSHTSISQAPRFMLGSVDLHSTLICCPGWRTCPTVGEISVAEYVPPALAVLTSCGAALSATAKTVASNTRIFILFFLRLIKKSCERERDRQTNLQLLFCHLARDCEMASYIDFYSANAGIAG